MAKRLTKELKDMEKNSLGWCTCGPVDDDITHWSATLVGPENSPYDGGIFSIDLQFPPEYPFKAPKVKFITRIYHPNVKTESGEICSGILNESWGPTLNVVYVLNAIRQMLLEPHADNPLEADIARQLAEDKEKFNITAAKWTMDYAS